MTTALERETQNAIKEQTQLRQEVARQKGELQAGLEREAILRGRIEQLELQLREAGERSDHNLRWAVEITKQMHNVGMFVSEALNIARQEVTAAKGNGRDIKSALDAVEKALIPQIAASKSD